MIDIKKTFLELTKKRYPKGTEDDVIKLIKDIKFEKDEFDNYYYIIKKKDGTYSNTMFTSHLDTVDRGSYNKIWDEKERKMVYKNNDNDKSVKHIFEDDFIKTDGDSNLGADDKAGVTIMLNLISEKVPGLYYFFMGEESGCIGSSNLSRKYEDKVKENILPKVDKCISFDRKGYDSIITEQTTGVSCSNEFATKLSEELNNYGFWYKPDDSGVYTDSAEFVDVISECTNLSVGYFDEHTTYEKQDIEFLELLSIVLTKIDWESLPIKRDIASVNYKGKKSRYVNSSYVYDDEYDYYNYNGYYNYNKETETENDTHYNKSKNKVNDNNIFDEEEFDKWYYEQKKKNFSFNEEVKE